MKPHKCPVCNGLAPDSCKPCGATGIIWSLEMESHAPHIPEPCFGGPEWLVTS